MCSKQHIYDYCERHLLCLRYAAAAYYHSFYLTSHMNTLLNDSLQVSVVGRRCCVHRCMPFIISTSRTCSNMRCSQAQKCAHKATTNRLQLEAEVDMLRVDSICIFTYAKSTVVSQNCTVRVLALCARSTASMSTLPLLLLVTLVCFCMCYVLLSFSATHVTALL
jgi:hypothetical protein